MSDDDTRPETEGPDDGVDDLLGAYALDALDDEERARVDERLLVDPEARAEVDRLARAVDTALAADAPEVAPPVDLWERIAVDLPSRKGPAAPPPGDELAHRRARRQPSTLGRALVAVAAAAVVVAIGVSALPESDDTSTSFARQLEREAEQVADEPGSRTATLTGTGTSATVAVVIAADGRGFVMADGLPVLSGDQTYQLWSLESAAPISLGLLGSDPTTAVVAMGGARERLAVSVEPAPGSTAPTTDPVLVGTLA